MRVVLVAVGTRGDVAPYTGLAAALAAAGHRPVIATHAPFRELVEACGAQFRELPVDLRAEFAGPRGRTALRASPAGAARFARLIAERWRELGRATADACAGADLVLVSAMGTTGYHVAEALGVPSAGAFLQPLDPTREFPPAVLTTRPLGGWGNRAATHALRVLGQLPFTGATNALRADLGLPPVGPAELFRRMLRDRWPVLYGFSPVVVPPPADWPPAREVTGYWWPHELPGGRPPPALAAFLAAGPPPVFVGFGSMTPDRDDLADVVVGALRRARVRGVVQAGWAGLSAAGDDVLTVGEVRHDWLFPRTAAVVHHGGAGTTAAVLRAGVPGVAVPVAADQPFWARRAADLGTGPEPVPARRLDVDRLGAAIGAALARPEHRRNARLVAEQLRAEDGAAAAVAAVERIAQEHPRNRVR